MYCCEFAKRSVKRTIKRSNSASAPSVDTVVRCLIRSMQPDTVRRLGKFEIGARWLCGRGERELKRTISGDLWLWHYSGWLIAGRYTIFRLPGDKRRQPATSAAVDDCESHRGSRHAVTRTANSIDYLPFNDAIGCLHVPVTRSLGGAEHRARRQRGARVFLFCSPHLICCFVFAERRNLSWMKNEASRRRQNKWIGCMCAWIAECRPLRERIRRNSF